MSYKFLVANGRSGAGAITLTGAAVGDRVIGVIPQTVGQNFVAPTSGDFETAITVINQVQQAASGDLTLIRYVFILETVDVATVAAAGSAQGDAAALSEGYNTVSAADGTKGVVLPTAVLGKKVWVYNEHASNGLKVYPNTSDDINDGTVNVAVTIEGKTLASFVALDATTWASMFTANS